MWGSKLKSNYAVNAIGGFIKANPYASAGIGAGLGVAGYLAARPGPTLNDHLRSRGYTEDQVNSVNDSMYNTPISLAMVGRRR